MRLRRILKKNKRFVLGVLVFILSLILSNIYTINAAPDCKMIDGEIIIRIESKAASANIRYRTLGFTITTKKAPENVTAKGITGPAAPPSPSAKMYLTEGEKTERDRTPEIVVTEYRFSVTKAQNAIKNIVDLDKISDVTSIYFNAIFQVYQVVDGKEVILAPEITTWQGIVNNQSWANSDVFSEYFNIEVEFKPGLQPNDLYYELDGNKIPQGALENMLIGQKVYWNERVASTTIINNTQYTLVGYYVKSKITGKETKRKMVGDSVTANDIINDSVTVLYGGMDIYMIYKPSTVEVIIHGVDKDTGQIIKRDMYRGIKNPGEDFEQAVDSVITADGIAYSKTVDFDYLYENSNGDLKKEKGKTSTANGPIKFKIPGTGSIKVPSKINVSVYYEKTASGMISVTVKAVNSATGAELQTLTTETVASGADYNYTVSESITAGGKSYSFTGEWKWQYKKNTSTAPIVSSSGSGTRVNFKAPSADNVKDGITVYVSYKLEDTKPDELSLRVIMVSITGALIEEISTETVSRGQSVSKTVQHNRTVKGTTYQYQDKWDYTYTISSGDTTKIGTGITVSFTVPQNTKLGTVITLKLYYDVIQDVVIPEPAPSIVLPIDTPSPYAVIDADKYGQPYFTSKNGISTTESQHVYVKTKDYLLGYRLVNKTGKVAFVVPVTMTYTLQYYTATPEEFGGPEEVTDTVSHTQHVTVERAYSYWEIESLEYYAPGMANVYNYSLPDGGVSLSTNGSYLNVPSLTTRHSWNRADHIVLPVQVREGIELTYSEPITSDSWERPTIEYEDLTPYALEMTDELMVKNDYLVFDGVTVMSDSLSEMIAPSPNAGNMIHTSRITHDKVLYTEGKVIDALKKNGVYPSNGNVTYVKHPMSVNSYDSTKFFGMTVNDVTIHTPVICEPILYSDNDKYVQLINPTEGAYHMVLDTDTNLNDFTVKISNTLPHSARLGYYERDFSRSFIDPENISYIAKEQEIVRNEMKLPFDVYIDTKNDKDPANDDIIKAGTWIVLGRDTHRFYVPMWVKEGVYTVSFRSTAVNGQDKLSNTEMTRNTDIHNYVATATRTFQISGRMYGLTIYDISDEGRWKDVFRIKDTMLFKYFEGAADGTKRTNYHDDYAYYYTVGNKNQYGYQTGRMNRFTLPIINGSHPKYKNVGAIKTGYAFRFRIDTIGEMYGSGNKIVIKPTFYHVDEKGRNRQLVDIYYDEEFYGKQHYLVKIGQGIDLANLQQGLVGNPYSRIPEAELMHTARVMETTYAKISSQYGAMYSYSDIRLTSQFRTFIGLDYAAHIAGLPSFNKVKEQIGETELNLSKYMQRWYGTYKLPANIHVAPAGYDVNDYLRKYGIDYHEDFWLKDGYIIVNFTIETYDMNNNRNLSYSNGANYLNNGHCSMWVMEGGQVEKKDNTDAAFSLKAGDVVFYFTSKKHSDDYMGRLY